LLGIYGGRATGIAEIARQRPELAACIDPDEMVPAAEIAFVVAEEMPRTLIDVVYRRTMIGLDANQGGPLYERIATIAASEFGWDDTKIGHELQALRDYSESLRV